MLVAAAAGAAITLVVGRQARDHDTDPASSAAGSTPATSDGAVVKRTLPGLVAPTGEPMLAGITAARPAPGAVVVAKGPFDDRFTLTRLRLHRTRISGVVTVTSDVSELLELQVLAGFYDRRGRLLGTNRYVRSGGAHRGSHAGSTSEVARFTVPVPRDLRARTASAAVGVPVLVNE